MNELVGSAILTVILLAAFYFIIASRLRLGFDTTVMLAVPSILIISLTFAGFSAIYAVLTVFVGLMIAWVFQIIIGNR